MVLRLLCLFLYTSWSSATLQEEVDSCPALPNWQDHFPWLPDLGRRVNVACPCMGIDGCGHALQAMSVPSSMLNCYDLEVSYRSALTQHLMDMGMNVIELNLGKKAGDLLEVPLQSLAPVDLLIAGPPCPPWAGQGKRRGCKDPKAQVFMRVVQWLVYFISSCGLVACILENVTGILNATEDGRQSVATKFLAILDKFCPEFHWSLDQQCAIDYLCPQTRWIIQMHMCKVLWAQHYRC